MFYGKIRGRIITRRKNMGEETVSKNFIEQEIDKDLKEGVYQEVCTRFPP